MDDKLSAGLPPHDGVLKGGFFMYAAIPSIEIKLLSLDEQFQKFGYENAKIENKLLAKDLADIEAMSEKDKAAFLHLVSL